MAKLPWMPFYPADYLLDTQLLSPAARGIWMDLICHLWRAETRGTMTLSVVQWSRILRADQAEVTAAFKELDLHSICEIETGREAITIKSRRMLKEERERKGSRVRQQRLREKGGGDPEKWAAIRVHILERDEYVCGYCGKKARTVDHIVPRSKGGDEHPDNLVAACKNCNNVKSNRSLKECGFTLTYSKHHAGHNGDITPYSQNQSQNQKLEEEKKETPSRALDALEKFAFEEVEEWVKAEGVNVTAAKLEFIDFKDYWRTVDGKRKGGRPIKDWPACFRTRIRTLKKEGKIGLVVIPRPRPELVPVEPKRVDPPTSEAKAIMSRLLPTMASALDGA